MAFKIVVRYKLADNAIAFLYGQPQVADVSVGDNGTEIQLRPAITATQADNLRDALSRNSSRGFNLNDNPDPATSKRGRNTSASNQKWYFGRRAAGSSIREKGRRHPSGSIHQQSKHDRQNISKAGRLRHITPYNDKKKLRCLLRASRGVILSRP